MNPVLFLLFYVIAIHGLSLKSALQTANCLNSCRKESCRNDCNKEITNFSIEPKLNISADANPILHCKDSHTIMLKHSPGIFVIEQRGFKKKWGRPRVFVGEFSTFSNLTSDENYRFRFWKVMENGFSQPELSNWIMTYKSDYIPEPIGKDKIYLQQVRNDENNFRELKALINFEPFDKMCSFNILFWAGEHKLISFNLNQPKSFDLNLKHLNYNQNHTIFITSINNKSKMSEQTSFSFITPSCLGMNFNSSYCAPNKVEELLVKEEYRKNSLYDITVNWKKPEFLPDNYTIQIIPFNLQKEPYMITVLGNETEAFFSSIELKLNYEISIIAESTGGSSQKVTLIKSVTGSTTIDAPSYYLIIAFSLLAVIIVIVVIIYLIQGKRDNKNIHYTYLKGFGQKNFVAEIKKKLQSEEYYKSGIKDLDILPKDKYEINPDQVEVKNLLGSGAYGVVRLGLLKTNCGDKTIEVAVKSLKDNPSTEDITSFHHEIFIMKCAGKHPNIVSLIGCCTLHKTPFLIVEFCSKGDLQTYLKKIWEGIINIFADVNEKLTTEKIVNYENNKINMNDENVEQTQMSTFINNKLYDFQEEIAYSTENITATDLLNFARQVATGMEFLSSNKIVHRDLAARNVLVCSDKVVKISDFGLSRDIYQENIYKKRSNGKLPIKWMAIEALTHQVYTTHSDVWSFGILLWEIVTMGGSPYPGIPTNELLKFLHSGYRMERPLNCGTELYNLMLACWNARPQNRPSFTMIKYDLDKLLSFHSKHTYLNPNDILKEPKDYYQLVKMK